MARLTHAEASLGATFDAEVGATARKRAGEVAAITTLAAGIRVQTMNGTSDALVG